MGVGVRDRRPQARLPCRAATFQPPHLSQKGVWGCREPALQPRPVRNAPPPGGTAGPARGQAGPALLALVPVLVCTPRSAS